MISDDGASFLVVVHEAGDEQAAVLVWPPNAARVKCLMCPYNGCNHTQFVMKPEGPLKEMGRIIMGVICKEDIFDVGGED